MRAVALDVGGGFGGKGQVYPEDLLMPFLARATGRPVRWIEERREHLLSATHSRDQIHDVEIGFDDERPYPRHPRRLSRRLRRLEPDRLGCRL